MSSPGAWQPRAPLVVLESSTLATDQRARIGVTVAPLTVGLVQ